MRRAHWVVSAALLLGCHRGAKAPEATPAQVDAPVGVAMRAETLWAQLDVDVVSGASGLNLPVIEGWVAEQPPEQTGLAARLRHVETGATVDVREALRVEDLPPWDAECEVKIDDVGPYRRLSAMRPVRVQICAPSDPQDRVREAYTGSVQSAVRLEVTWPLDGVHRARQAVYALLAAARSR